MVKLVFVRPERFWSNVPSGANQAIYGTGFPLAVQANVALTPWTKGWPSEIQSTRAGTESTTNK